ncbi:MAG TPA: hypothetical protein VGY55_13195 [Pirellulales bacterium]|jgi:predicted nucleic acid-binding protein|nr:hypothetical protein [Pirellulales bacterium]
MIHGLDTGFLVAAEVIEHAAHSDARAILARLIGAGDLIAIAPQVLAEFIHIATDSRRFVRPLDVATACAIAEQWWTARDVVHAHKIVAAASPCRTGGCPRKEGKHPYCLRVFFRAREFVFGRL